jgi:ATP-dependent helicase/DNAse subunit B
MAEHLRNEMAREGFPVRPSRVGTLTHFLDRGAGPPESWDLPLAAPESLLHILIAEALERLRPPRFERVLESRGLHAELVKLIEQAPDPQEWGGDLGNIFSEVEAQLEARGFALRSRRLQVAAKRLRSGEASVPQLTIFDGFFSLAPAEVVFIEALAERGGVIVTLPDGLGDQTSRRRLIRAGFSETRFTEVLRAPERVVFAAATPEREAEEIARRILGHAALGRQFREMGVVVRSRDPYAPLVETTLARFGIPARSYFLDSLASHPAVAYLAGVVRAMLGGWDHADIGELLRQPVSGVGATEAGDRLDFELRERLPGNGLPVAGLRAAPDVLEEFKRMAAWRSERLVPAGWAARLRTLVKLVAQPAMAEPEDRDQVHVWRSTAAALARFEEIVEETAAFHGSEARLPEATVPETTMLEPFWKQVETALAVESLQVADRRRNVVHIMDVYEARQWELPVVFVCGLLERVFPKYHGENPVLGDAERRRLGLPGSTEAQAEERFLFDLASTRATEQVVLSYAQFDEKGEETLPSFFLEGREAIAVSTRVQPKPRRVVHAQDTGPIQDATLLREIATRRRTLSASAIESFLQCPFRFFARHTLKLNPRPAAPRDRLDVLLQGSIVHQALAEWMRMPLLGAEVLDRVFEEECERRRIPRTYRTEAVRLEMLRHFEMFLDNHEVELGWKTKVEEKFEFALSPELSIRGRIDRLETGPNGQALVIDYKYSGQVKDKVEQNESGSLVQGGLYLLAAERAFGLEPAGMLYCGVKKKVNWVGWQAISGLREIGEPCTPERLRELAEDAARKASETHAAILAGRVEVHPAEPKKCDWCDYRDICRVEAIMGERAPALGSGAGG